MIYLLTATG